MKCFCKLEEQLHLMLQKIQSPRGGWPLLQSEGPARRITQPELVCTNLVDPTGLFNSLLPFDWCADSSLLQYTWRWIFIAGHVSLLVADEFIAWAVICLLAKSTWFWNSGLFTCMHLMEVHIRMAWEWECKGPGMAIFLCKWVHGAFSFCQGCCICVVYSEPSFYFGTLLLQGLVTRPAFK